MAMADANADPTHELVRGWHRGDRAALLRLVEDNLPWIRELVSRRMGPALRRHDDSQDGVQDAVLEVLERGPRFVPKDRDQFRALLAQLVENLLRDRAEWLTAQKRDYRREQDWSNESVLVLDPAVRDATRPSEAAARAEDEAWVQLALELLPPADRRLVLMRQWQGLTFGDIGRELGIEENTARMRFQAALQRLGDKLRELRCGGGGPGGRGVSAAPRST